MAYNYQYARCPSGYPVDCGSYCCGRGETCRGGGCAQSTSSSGAGVAITISIVVISVVVAVCCIVGQRRRRATANAQMLALSNAQHVASAQQMAVLSQGGQVAYYQPGAPGLYMVQPGMYSQGYAGAPVHHVGMPVPQQPTTYRTTAPPTAVVAGYLPAGAPDYQVGTPVPQQPTTYSTAVVAAPDSGAQVASCR